MRTQITTPKGLLASFEEVEIGPVPLDRVVQSEREYGLRLLFSPDGNHLGYVLNEDGGQCAVVDGKRGAIYDHVDALRFGAGVTALSIEPSRAVAAASLWTARKRSGSTPCTGSRWSSVRTGNTGLVW